jgi:hypothetical protein
VDVLRIVRRGYNFLSPAEFGVLPEISCGFSITCIQISTNDAAVAFSLTMSSGTLENMDPSALDALNSRSRFEEDINRRVPFFHESVYGLFSK